MVLESKKFFLKKAYIYSDDQKFKEFYLGEKYSSIVAISYGKLDENFLSLYTHKKNFKIRVKPITRIDLRLSEEEIFKKFNDTAKKHVRRTFKNNELVFGHIIHPTGESYAVYADFEYSQGRVPMSEKEFKTYRLFNAAYRGKEISGISLVESHPYVRTITIYSKRLATDDKETYKIIAQATRRIVYEICLWAKKEGFTMFDLGSINVVDPAKAGITDFKLSFGGDVMPEYTYIYKSRLFGLFEKLVYFKIIALRFWYLVKTIFYAG